MELQGSPGRRRILRLQEAFQAADKVSEGARTDTAVDRRRGHLKEKNPVETPERETTAAKTNGSSADTPDLGTKPEAPVDSALLFQDWTIKRAERRVRRLFVAVVVVTLGAGLWLFSLQAQLNDVDPSASAPVEPRAAVSAEDGALRQALFGTSDVSTTADDVVGSIERRIERIERSLDRFRSDRSRLGRCVTDQLRGLDQSLRRLLERQISANQYVNRPPLHACR